MSVNGDRAAPSAPHGRASSVRTPSEVNTGTTGSPPGCTRTGSAKTPGALASVERGQVADRGAVERVAVPPDIEANEVERDGAEDELQTGLPKTEVSGTAPTHLPH